MKNSIIYKENTILTVLRSRNSSVYHFGALAAVLLFFRQNQLLQASREGAGHPITRVRHEVLLDSCCNNCLHSDKKVPTDFLLLFSDHSCIVLLEGISNHYVNGICNNSSSEKHIAYQSPGLFIRRYPISSIQSVMHSVL